MAEKEYIERGALLATLNQNNVTYNADVNYFITTAPTADVQEVIRCKDCEFGEYDNELKMILCKRIYNLSGGELVYNNLNDFCSYGAKMDKEFGQE
ncbi:MAG: hypothetical protein ACI4IS_00245 [Acutalibacteraceae bacterium]